MPGSNFIRTVNAEAVGFMDIPVMDFADFRDKVVEEIKAGARISAMPACPDEGGLIRIIAVLSRPVSGEMVIGSTCISGSWQSITPDCPAVHWFEREIAEIHNVTPEGHPWLKPIRFQPPHDISLQEYSVNGGSAKFFSLDGKSHMRLL
jgi:NADH:ubiquinone oxidoreductase subunit C